MPDTPRSHPGDKPKTEQVYIRRKGQIVELLLTGLNTDGAHHTQYYLEKALRLLTNDAYVDRQIIENGFESGIP